MSALSPILRQLAGGLLAFHCPGCGYVHHVRIAGGPPCWSYNGDPERPTFTPSILVTYNGDDAGIDDAPPAVCHSYVTDGRIRFLSDCTHALAGQTVDLPSFEGDT